MHWIQWFFFSGAARAIISWALLIILIWVLYALRFNRE